ncbi:MAG: carboxylesterase/lipase family protein, partial [Acidobacteriota bacterium]|nr:carboxylesterase/lipase family protein [Acidobacteriota bacterium]
MSTRRLALKQLSALTAGALAGGFPGKARAQQSGARSEAVLSYDAHTPVVKTSAGAVRGYIRNRIHTFKGIPYGETTAGKNRFMPPVPRTPWTGVFPAVAYGYACPQIHGKDWANPESHFLFNYDVGEMDEDCLRLNVWTQGLDAGKRPVLVWIHGGGYTNGSSFEMIPYDGENICRRGDIVFVSVNHRLNVLGFLDLSGVGGAAFAPSANAGMLDLAAALEWVRDNIAQFGGDPGNVTICGQSGGGAKVNTLMAMPAARGLFQRGIVQSGSLSLYRAPANSRAAGDRLAEKLHVNRDSIATLQTLPYGELMAAATSVIAELNRSEGGAGIMGRFGWSPTADGTVVTGKPAVGDGPELSAGIPLIVGYTRNEMSTSAFDPSAGNLTEAEVRRRLERTYPGKSAALLEAFRADYPSAGWPELYSMAASMFFANGSIRQVEERARLKPTPVYAYRFDWRPDIRNGNLGAFHSLDIAFTFD